MSFTDSLSNAVYQHRGKETQQRAFFPPSVGCWEWSWIRKPEGFTEERMLTLTLRAKEKNQALKSGKKVPGRFFILLRASVMKHIFQKHAFRDLSLGQCDCSFLKTWPQLNETALFKISLQSLRKALGHGYTHHLAIHVKDLEFNLGRVGDIGELQWVKK